MTITRVAGTSLMIASLVAWGSSAHGATLCQKRSGAVVVRDACKKKETPLDLAQFGPPAPTPTVVADNPSTDTDPCTLQVPATATFCGTTAHHWFGEATGAGSVKLWRDRTGTVHIAGSAYVSDVGGIRNSEPVFYLPADLRPTELVVLPVAVAVGSADPTWAALLNVNPSGAAQIFNPSMTGMKYVFFGDLTFRTEP